MNAGSRGEIALSICEAREAEAVPTLKEMRGISNIFKDPALLLVLRAGTGTGTGTGGGGKGVRGIVVAEDRPSSL